jgi:hypothetical protein
MNKQSLIIGIITALVAGSLAFYGGTVYAKSQTPQGSLRGSFAGAPGGGSMAAGKQAGARAGGGGMTAGSVVSNDGTSLVVSLASGGSKNVLISDSTQFLSLQKAAASDVKQGISVMVTGTPNADGSVTATMIQIRPADGQDIPGFGGGRGQNSTGTPMGDERPSEPRVDR